MTPFLIIVTLIAIGLLVKFIHLAWRLRKWQESCENDLSQAYCHLAESIDKKPECKWLHSWSRPYPIDWAIRHRPREKPYDPSGRYKFKAPVNVTDMDVAAEIEFASPKIDKIKEL